MRRHVNNRAFTLVEMMIAVTFSVFLLAGVCSFYNSASQTYSAGISGQTLQDGANTIISKIAEGETESGVVYRLSTASTFTFANGTSTNTTNSLYTCGGTSQVLPCNSSNPASEIYYCQDNPVLTCTPPGVLCNCNPVTDNTARWYYLNSTGTSVLYHHPTSGGKTVEETLFTAPKGSSLTLRFSPAQANGATLPNVIEIDVALTQNLSANITNKRLATSGAASTFVLVRNHP